MRNVRFTSSSGPNWPWRRQLPRHREVWADKSVYSFDTYETRWPEPVADWLVIYDGLFTEVFDTQVPLERRIFVAGEPESFYQYQPDFLAQFGTVITPQANTKHLQLVVSQPAVNWFAGVQFQRHGDPGIPLLDFEDFLMPPPAKSKLCSVICSDKTVTSGHRQRKEFVDRLMLELGDRIDFFGRGRNPMDDKDIALREYRFHIALENSSHPHYWTEKLADPYLRGCFPIYSGCANVGDYFPQGSYVAVDLREPDLAIDIIAKTLEKGITAESVLALAEAKHRVMFDYNIFAVLERAFERLEPDALNAQPLSEPTRLLRDAHFKKMNRFGNRVISRIQKSLGLIE